MITFYELGKYGRLGNQLFQYAALKALALKNNYDVKIPDFSDSVWHGQECLLKNFNLECETFTNEDLRLLNQTCEEQNSDVYDPNFFKIPDNTNIRGFFQSVHYFSEFEDQIKKELTPKKQFVDKAKAFLEPHRENGKYELVSIHVRRGDMVTHMHEMSPDLVFSRQDIFDNNTIFGNYLTKAVKLFDNKDVKYVIFAGGKRDGDDSEDISFVKDAFEGDQFIISDSNDPMFDFTAIMHCDHNITCHQSTFGWWAAHLNPNKNKIVTSPRNYYFIFDRERNEKRTSPENGHFPPDWTII